MNSLEFKNVTKSYKDFKLSNITFALPKGCIMGIVGENGAGKSTLIKLIFNIVNRDCGEIFIMGEDNLKNFEPVKEDTGVVLDENAYPEAFDSNKIDKVMRCIYKNWDSDCFFNLLKRLGIDRSKKIKELSKGTKMKLSIAVALSHEAKLLILDEPTNGLDPVVRDEILEIFLEFTRNEENAVLITSHIISDLEKICDYIMYLSEGRLVFCEEKDALYEKYALLNLSDEDFSSLPDSAIVYTQKGKYSTEVLALREKVPEDFDIQKDDLEKILVFLAKEAIK